MYAQEFPFIDYGIDLSMMSEMEKGVQLYKLRRSDNDANPPEAVKKKLEEQISKLKAKRKDLIPEKFVGKGGRGYVLKNLVMHKGLGAPIVNKGFKDALRLTGTEKEHKLSKDLNLRMKLGGPRYAGMGVGGRHIR